MTFVVLAIAVVCVGIAAWLRAAGTAIARIPRADAWRDAGDDIRGAGAIADLLEDRDLITPALQVVISGLMILAAVLAMAALATGETVGSAIGYGLAVGLVVFLGGDLLPRQVGRRRPTAVAYRSSRLLGAAIRLGGWANDLLPDLETVEGDDGNGVDEDSEEHERELIDSVLEFGETVVREVMTPRPDMVTVPVTATVAELVSVASAKGYSRIPIVSNGDVVGQVIVRDLLPMLSDGRRPPSVAAVMRPVEFVPETKLASALLAEMQANHTHQMIVVDEYGDVAGLITIEDLLEELVGEIADETDDEEIFISARTGGGWDVDARLPVEDLAEVAGVELPDEEWDTVGGLVLGLAERVPEVGERFSHGRVTFTVTRMQGRRVSEVQVTRLGDEG